MNNSHLLESKKNKNDEYFTQIGDIEKELQYYYEDLEGKIVYCNCDKPHFSEFYSYFFNNFRALKLKEAWFSYFSPFRKTSFWRLYLSKRELKCEVIPLECNGSYDSEELLEYFKKADIIITNPPYSLYRKYIEYLYAHNKKFLIVGPVTSVGYKDIFQRLKDGRIFCGVNSLYKFETPYWDIKTSQSHWFTNIKNVDKYKKDLEYKHSYYLEKNEYPKYDNYDAIEAEGLQYIPEDYYGIIGVSDSTIPFLKLNEWELIDNSLNSVDSSKFKKYINPIKIQKGITTASNNVHCQLNLRFEDVKNSRLIRKYKNKEIFYGADNSKDLLIGVYKRILIRRKR